jgi:hypothetical protein
MLNESRWKQWKGFTAIFRLPRYGSSRVDTVISALACANKTEAEARPGREHRRRLAADEDGGEGVFCVLPEAGEITQRKKGDDSGIRVLPCCRQEGALSNKPPTPWKATFNVG